ncbi:hypothetical protein HK28_01260 [Acetobacter sp. DsW_063]|nr:hypothetical protein HK28_01260 [Acetobacter sp. DsW_063]
MGAVLYSIIASINSLGDGIMGKGNRSRQGGMTQAAKDGLGQNLDAGFMAKHVVGCRSIVSKLDRAQHDPNVAGPNTMLEPKMASQLASDWGKYRNPETRLKVQQYFEKDKTDPATFRYTKELRVTDYKTSSKYKTYNGKMTFSTSVTEDGGLGKINHLAGMSSVNSKSTKGSN